MRVSAQTPHRSNWQRLEGCSECLSLLGAALFLFSLAMLLLAPRVALDSGLREGLRLGSARLGVEQLHSIVNEPGEALTAESRSSMIELSREVEERLFESGPSWGPPGMPLSTRRFLESIRHLTFLDAGSATPRDLQPIAVLGKTALIDLDHSLTQTGRMNDVFVEAQHNLRHRGQVTFSIGGLFIVVSLLVGALSRRSREVRRADSRYRAIFEQHPLPIIVHDGQGGGIEDANPAASRQFGWTLEELRELTVADLRPQCEEDRMAELPYQETSEFVGLWTHCKRDGTLFVAEVATSTLDDLDRELRWTVIKDVTERERAQQRLTAEEGKFRSVAECLGEGVLVMNLDGLVTYANPRALEITGRGPDEIVGRIVQEELEETRGTIERRLRERRRGLAEVYLQEFERPDGAKTWIEVHSAPLTGVEGGVQGVVAVIADVTQRIEAERSLRDRESRLRTVLQQVPVLVWTTDLELRFTSFQGSMWSGEMIKPESLVELVEAGLSDEAVEAHRRALAGEVADYEVEFDGRWYRCRVEPYRDVKGTVSGTVGAGLDVTDAKRAEEERERLNEQLHRAYKMEAIGRLAGGIAHDFNNLLTIIDGNAEMHCMSLAGEVPEEMEEIRKAAHSASALTQQLLAFSRQQVFQPRVVEVDASVRQTCRLLRRVIGEDIDLVLSEGCGDARIVVDTPQLHQVLLNLAVNARDAMPDGGRLEIRTDRVTLGTSIALDGNYHPGESLEPGEYAQILVSDTGTGIDGETLKRVFEPFFTTKESDVGSGLGLSSVHGIVRQSGGAVTVNSRPGEGTEFTILLPLTERTDSPWMLPTLAGPRAETETRILLAEDESGLRRMLCRGLRRRGYSVVDAATGSEALESLAASEKAIDLVITDVLMPDMRGTELVKRMAETDPNLRVLFISGYTDDALQLEHGIPQFLQKPFTVSTLAQRVEELLRLPPGVPPLKNVGNTA